MRRSMDELAPSTVASYRTRIRKLYLKVQSGQAVTADRLELAELEALLGVRGSDIPPPGRPRKWASRSLVQSVESRSREQVQVEP